MALPGSSASFRTAGPDLPKPIAGDPGSTDHELYEEDGEFVLAVEMPGFDREEIDLAWDDGVLDLAAERVDDERGRRRTYHRQFRFPKDINGDAVTATYTNGVLEISLPDEEGAHGRAIPIEG